MNISSCLWITFKQCFISIVTPHFLFYRTANCWCWRCSWFFFFFLLLIWRRKKMKNSFSPTIKFFSDDFIRNTFHLVFRVRVTEWQKFSPFCFSSRAPIFHFDYHHNAHTLEQLRMQVSIYDLFIIITFIKVYLLCWLMLIFNRNTIAT